MKNKLRITILVLIVGFLVMSCNQSNQQKQNSETKDIKGKKAQETKVVNVLCFKNEFPFQDNSSMKDVEELTLTIDGEKVTGTYNWLPAEKDQRKGSLAGTIKDKIIDAQYTFVQEGNEDEATLKIYIDSNKAIIKGGAPELGLEITIKKIDCD